ncbi:MAG: Asp-tRNA(Asn)/Glu-tRNA(Gln) amidotransferase subunit GatA, partial [bacterium]
MKFETMNLNQLTIKEASEKLKTQKISSLELTEACLKRIKEVDKKINACLTVCDESARHGARIADERRAKGEDGVLLGIPFIAKDNIMAKGVRATAASKILENYIAPYDATVIKKLKSAGAVLLAKANMDEFAHGASGENSAFGPTHNPWNLDRVPGGSSSGPAAAVAANMCIFSMGTDTGGSIRCPAAFCGVSGLKPTYGRVSRFGLIAMTSSTDVPGPITKTAEDAAIILGVIAGPDKLDATTSNSQVSDYTKEISQNIKKMRIGVSREFLQGAQKSVIEKFDDALKQLEKSGAEIIDIKLPHAKYGIPVYYIITPSEISSNLARFDGVRYGFGSKEAKNLADFYKKSRGARFGPEAKRRIMLGTYVLSAGYYDAYYKKAQKVRTIIKKELNEEL